MAPPTSQQQSKYEGMVDTSFDTADPSIGYTFAKSEQNLKDKFSNPWGFNYSPEVAEASVGAGVEELNQQRGLAYRADANQRRQGKLGAQAVAAGYSAPQLAQTGGSMEGSQTQPWGPAVIGAIGTAAGGALG